MNRRFKGLVLVGVLATTFVPAFAGVDSPDRDDHGNHNTHSNRSWHRGMSWTAAGEITRAELAPLTAQGVDWIVQTPFGWQRGPEIPEVRLVTGGRIYWGERDVGLETTTRLARELGIRTLLKPHIWLRGGKWRGDIAMKSEADWQKWFTSYRQFILHYARFAERIAIEGLCIGTELHRTVLARPEDWRRLIAEIRSVYKGELTYAANWYREFEQVPFWSELDYIGIQAYFPLSKNERPSVAELRQGWVKHLPAIQAVQKKHQRPVLFTEIGYTSSPGAAIEPWVWPERFARPQEVDLETQANAYSAFFQTFWHQPWFAGSYFWKWIPTTTSASSKVKPDNVSFSPQGKPALAVLRRWYQQSDSTPAFSTESAEP